MATDRLKILFRRYLDGTCTPAEKEELAARALDAGNEDVLLELISQSWELTGDEEDMPAEKAAKLLSSILRTQQRGDTRPQPTRILSLPAWRRVAVAAIIFLIAGLSVWQLMLHKKSAPVAVANQVTLPAPAAVKATITLANGRQIMLDSVATGKIATEGDMQVIKGDNGEIHYEGGKANGIINYNTLFNPRGSKIAAITLADGTRVWLNSESTLKYFSGVGNEARKVELSGEAYFEVARDAQHQFIVNANGISTEVLGTGFNIKRYHDDAAASITLLEGAIKVTRGKDVATLKPGQQAKIANTIEVRSDADTESAVAWKNGYFSFQDQPLSQVLKQVSRCYDIEIIYENKTPDIVFFGEIENSVNLAQMLRFLERSGVKLTMNADKRQLIIH
jgi:ferric-dicitrate binding protein FerR (iron transport regulator)